PYPPSDKGGPLRSIWSGGFGGSSSQSSQQRASLGWRRLAMQIAKSSRPERARAHSSKEGAEGGSARGVNPYQQFVRVQNKQNRTRGSKSCLSHSSGRSRSVDLPRRRMCSARGGRRRRGAAICMVRIPCTGDVAQL